MFDQTSFVVDSSRRLIRAAGPDNRKFLQGLISNNIERVTENQPIFACLLTPQGKFLFDFFIYQFGEDILIDVFHQRAEDLIKRLNMYKLRAKVTFDLCDDLSVAWSLQPPQVHSARWLADPRHPALGQRAIVEHNSVQDWPKLDLSQSADFLAWRVDLGIPDSAFDLEIEKTLLMEAGYEELHAIDFKKGCYVGQELTARTKYRAKVRKRLLQIQAHFELPQAGTLLMAAEREAGILTSVAGTKAIARVRLEHLKDNLTVDGRDVRVVVPDWVKLPDTSGAA